MARRGVGVFVTWRILGGEQGCVPGQQARGGQALVDDMGLDRLLFRLKAPRFIPSTQDGFAGRIHPSSRS
jgi:hypothetical protein